MPSGQATLAEPVEDFIGKLKPTAKRGGNKRCGGKLSPGNPQCRETLFTGPVKVRVGGTYRILQLLRIHGQAGKIMLAVALDMPDTQCCLDREVV